MSQVAVILRVTRLGVAGEAVLNPRIFSFKRSIPPPVGFQPGTSQSAFAPQTLHPFSHALLPCPVVLDALRG